MKRTDRDRLIELLKQATTLHLDYLESIDQKGLTDTEGRAKFTADHLLANGVILPPCKVGDIVCAKYSGTNEIEYYVIDEVTHLGSYYFKFEAHLENVAGYTVDIIEFGAPEIGLTVFLTREEAERALKELGK